MRGKDAAGPNDIPPTFLKALGPMDKAETLSIPNESFSKGAGNLEGSHLSSVKKRQANHHLLPTCQSHILCCQDNADNGASNEALKPNAENLEHN